MALYCTYLIIRNLIPPSQLGDQRCRASPDEQIHGTGVALQLADGDGSLQLVGDVVARYRRRLFLLCIVLLLLPPMLMMMIIQKRDGKGEAVVVFLCCFCEALP